MTTVAVITILAGMLLPGLSRAKLSARRIACLNNLKQMGVASHLYAADDRLGAYANTLDDSDDNQNWLLPYLPELKAYSCPGTKNTVRPYVLTNNLATGLPELLDLAQTAENRLGFGSSYEVYGFMNYNGGDYTTLMIGGTATVVPGIQKNAASVVNYVHKNALLGLQGISPGPSRIWLMLDGSPAFGNYPRGNSNHGAAGLNVEFCDGHVEWVTQRHWWRSYELSQDEGTPEP